MEKRWCLGIVLVLPVLLAGPAVAGTGGASEPDSFYMALRGGPGWADQAERSPESGSGAKLKFESEYDLNLAAGYRFLSWLRAEGELGFVNMSLDNLELENRGQTVDANGQDRQYRGMVNVYLDGANSTAFTPFIGAGAGAIRANLDLSWTLPRSGATVKTDDWDWAFAWQFMAGIGWRVAPRLEVELAYRYYGSDDRSHANHSTANNPDVVVDGTRASFVQAGLRYYF